jgi:hypothetical protein
MALIACSDCGREVSDRAPACPQCGAPIAAQAAPAQTTTPGLGKDVRQKVEIEATNRGLKTQMLLAFLCAFGGCVGMVSSPANGGGVIWAMVMIGGLIWWLIVRMAAWYRNG